MSDHLTAQQLDRYRRKAMGPAEIIEALDHAATCVGCREQLAAKDQLRNAFIALGPAMYEPGHEGDLHLAPEQIAAYVDDEIDTVEREIAETHLELCRQCKAEVIDLKEIKDAMSIPSTERPVGRRAAGLDVRSGGLWSTQLRRILLPAGVAASLIVVLFLVTVGLRRQVAELRSQVSALQERNKALEEQVSSIPSLQTTLSDLQRSNAELLTALAPAVALHDGDRLVTLDRQGNLTGLDSLLESSRQVVRAALRSQHVEMAASLADLKGKREVLMGSGGADSFSVVSPVGEVLETDRPTFRWAELGGASAYTVTVYDAGLSTVATSPELTATEWTVSRPLKRGGVYSWDVAARKDGKEVVSPSPPAPPATFRILDHGMLNELDHARRAYPGSHLVLGVLYGRAGMMEDAERELKALAGENPQSGVAQKLLGSVRSAIKR